MVVAGGLVLLLSLGGVGIALDRAFSAATENTIQERLENAIYVVLAVIQFDQEDLGLNASLPDDRLEQPGSGLFVGVQTQDLLWRSPSAITDTLQPIDFLSAGREQFSRGTQAHQRYVLAMGLEWETDDGELYPLTIWAEQRHDVYDQQMSNFRRALWPWLGAAGVVIVVAQWLSMWLSMQPLRTVAQQVKTIESGQAEQLAGCYPVELKPLTDNLNALLLTERGNRERYRKALGDLAHSLKTPLAVLRESLQGSASLNDDLHTARGAVDDMQQTIARQLERAAAATRRTHAKPVTVAPVVRRIQSALDKVYQQRYIHTALHIDDDVVFFGEERDLMEICGNLLENAYKYGHGQVQVHAHAIAPSSRRPGLILCIEDDGPGINAEDFQRLLRRGERGDQRAEGQGLGLAIVAELVNAYDARFEVSASALGGAAMQITIPPL